MHALGGAERLTTDLATGLAQRGAEVELVTGVSHPVWRGMLDQSPCSVTVRETGRRMPGSLRFWLHAKECAKLLAERMDPSTDVAVTSSFPSSLTGELAAQQNGVKTLHYLHEAPMVLHDHEGVKTLPLRQRLFYTAMSHLYAGEDKEAVRESDLILANSHLCARANAQAYGLREARIRVIYPGVNPANLTPSQEMPPENGEIGEIGEAVEEGVPLFTFPRGAKHWWSPETSLRALRGLRIGRFTALFTGGSEREGATLLKKGERLGVEGRLLWFRGLSNPELNAAYSHSTAVVSVPRRQPFGLTPLEALVCGAPPITSRSSGVTEVLREGRDLLCVPPRDWEGLRDAMEELATDTEAGERIVSRGRRRVLDRLSIHRFVDGVERSLMELLDRRGAHK